MATSPSLPAIPAPQNVQVSPFQMPFQPVTLDQFLSFNSQLFDQQMQQREALYADTFQNIAKWGDDWISQALTLDKEFMPQYSELYTGLLDQANPQFTPIYNQLGESVLAGLNAGYDLGPDLSHQMEQSIRAAQTARGNWMGTAPTAQEAFGKGEASVNLYNLRVGQAQNFLNSKQPTDMWGALESSSKYGIWDQNLGAQAANAQMNPTIAPNVFGTFAQSQSSYNATAANAYGSYVQGTIGAAQVNNQSAFDAYNASFDQFLYRQSVQNGLFSMPSVGGGGMGSMMGPMMGGIGTALGGVGAAVGGGLGAGIGVAGAAAGAAAALCWLARKLIPDKWKSFRKYLFTTASADERRDYIYNARRLSNAIP